MGPADYISQTFGLLGYCDNWTALLHLLYKLLYRAAKPKVKPSHCPIGQELRRLFDYVDGLTDVIELHHPVLARFIDIIGEHGRAVHARHSAGELRTQAMAI